MNFSLKDEFHFFLELSVGMQTDGIEIASVGNTYILHESCLVEAFNLKAAIQFNLRNCKFINFNCAIFFLKFTNYLINN